MTDSDRDEAHHLAEIRGDLVCALEDGHHQRATQLAQKALGIAEGILKGTDGGLHGESADIVRYIAFLQFMVGKNEVAKGILEGFRLAPRGSVSFYKSADTYPLIAEGGALSNMLVDPSYWLVSDPTTKTAYTGRTASFSFKIPNQHVWRNDEGTILITKKPQARRLHQPVFLLGSKNNYKHWITDYLPRLKFYLDEGSNLPILMGDEVARFHVDSLEMAGISQENIIRVSDNEMLRCDALQVGPIPRRMEHLEPWAMAWLASTFSSRDIAGPERLYVSRDDARTRRIVNEKQVIEHLKTRGFETVTPGKLSFSEQLAIFANARVVVGLHGAGLANIAFTRPDAQLIEIIPSRNRETEIPSNANGFARMAIASKRRHQFFPATSVDEARFSKDNDVLVDVETLIGLIESG